MGISTLYLKCFFNPYSIYRALGMFTCHEYIIRFKFVCSLRLSIKKIGCIINKKIKRKKDYYYFYDAILKIIYAEF